MSSGFLLGWFFGCCFGCGVYLCVFGFFLTCWESHQRPFPLNFHLVWRLHELHKVLYDTSKSLMSNTETTNTLTLYRFSMKEIFLMNGSKYLHSLF